MEGSDPNAQTGDPPDPDPSGGGNDPDAQGGDGDAGTQGGSGQGSTLSVEDARKVRSENRNLRQRLKEAETERDRLKQVQMSDQERLQSNLETVSKSNQTLIAENRNLRAQVAASRVGIVDPEIVVGLVDWEDADDDASLERQMKSILKAKPYLAGNVAGGADGAARGPNGATGDGEDMNSLLRRRAGVIQ